MSEASCAVLYFAGMFFGAVIGWYARQGWQLHKEKRRASPRDL